MLEKNQSCNFIHQSMKKLKKILIVKLIQFKVQNKNNMLFQKYWGKLNKRDGSLSVEKLRNSHFQLWSRIELNVAKSLRSKRMISVKIRII